MSKLRKSLSPTYRRQKGFTLIELLVVIAIIAILAAIVLAALGSARAKGRDARRISDVKQIQNALEMYNDTTGGYPVGDIAAATAALVPTYISSMPTDPGSGSYTYLGTATTYDVTFTLEIGSGGMSAGAHHGTHNGMN